MILTVERKKKFLITMIVVMVCAVAINFGLYNVLSSYFKSESGGGGGGDIGVVTINILTVIIIISIVTVIMVILIPKESVNEIMFHIEQNGGGGGGAQTTQTNTVGFGRGNNSDRINNDLDDDGLDDNSDEQQLQNMVDEDLDNNGNKK